MTLKSEEIGDRWHNSNEEYLIEENTRRQLVPSTGVSKSLSEQLPSSTTQICRREQDVRYVDASERKPTHVLGEPAETFSVTLPLDDGDHEEFDGTDVIERNLALSDTCYQLGPSG